ncbi:hypothetical protein BFC19_01160 [Brochothrix thermosphacta]|nr:hypothetical protein BFC19_01160 [Brochothrix thermosphacta]SOC31768.1 hypothetical protein BTH160X_60301 [Brochothrix thermosphacta]
MKNRLFLLIIFGALLLVHIIFNIETIIPGMFGRFIKGVVSFGFFTCFYAILMIEKLPKITKYAKTTCQINSKWFYYLLN